MGAVDVYALLSDGSVEYWGFDSPTPVPEGLSGVTAFSGGTSCACALLSGGSVECLGSNLEGALGNGTTTSSTTPVLVSGLSGVTAISEGSDDTEGAATACALLSGGTVECWGDNIYGELGDGSSTGPETCPGYDPPCSTTPVAVSGLSGVTAVSVGGDSVCALLSGGTVECWGNNPYGELGNGTTTGSTTPVAVVW
jgi:alpha-tubulin suppressor-like RCC1 family protein